LSSDVKKEKKGLLEKIKSHKILTIVIVVLLIITLIRFAEFGIRLAGSEEAEANTVSVRTAVSEYTNISRATPLSGRISPAEEAAIFPMGAGQVTAVHVKVGDYVTAGTLLFEIDKGTVSTSYNQAKAAYDLAKSNYENMSILYAEGAISKADYDAVHVNYVSASETYKAAAEQYSFFNVTSPIDGYVTSLNVSVGNLASSGQMAASVANTDALQIKTTVSEYIASIIEINDVVDVYVESLGTTPYSGTVTAFSPVPAFGTLTYPITITLDNSSGDLLSGMFAEIQIKAEEAKNAVCINSDAVIMKNGVSVVCVLKEDNIPYFQEVTTGIDNGEMVEITSGLDKGEVVVISGQDFVIEGIAVRVIE